MTKTKKIKVTLLFSDVTPDTERAINKLLLESLYDDFIEGKEKVEILEIKKVK